MRILHVSTVLAGDGGIPTYLHGLLRAQAELGHEVQILSVGPAVAVPGCDVVALPSCRPVLGRYHVPTGVVPAVRALGRRADVVHVHQPFAPLTVAASTLRRPKVLSSYLHAPLLATARRRAQYRLLTARFDGLVAISGGEADLVRRAVGPRALVAVSSPGVPDDVLEARSRMAPARSGVVCPPRTGVVSASRLVPHKRVDLLIEAHVRSGTDEPLVVIGDGPSRPGLERVARDLGLVPGDIFRGPLDRADLVDELVRAKVFATLSEEESFGIGLQEGVAAGCVPLASDIASHREIVVGSGWDGARLVPVGADPLGAATALLAALATTSAPTAPPRRWVDSAAELVEVYQGVA